jgi:DNA-binding NtrC family response regulator
MKKANLLVLDLNTEPHLAETLHKILSDFYKLNVQLLQQPLSRPESLAELSEKVPRAFGGWQPSLCFFVFPAELKERACAAFSGLKRYFASVPVIAVTNATEPESLLELLKLGVADFITLPLKPFDIYPRVVRLLQSQVSEEPLTQLLKEKLGLKQLVGQSPAFLEQIKKISVVAKTSANVLILGETGTGKELCARAIHYLSPRAALPFVAVNCGALPAELAENELFGHEPGAYTGATTSQPGLIQEAQGGTLLLDEIDSLSLSVQAKLLRFLQEKEFRALGSTKTLRADVRVIAAANGDLEAQVRNGKLRQDLYYRLNVVNLTLPPLRERQKDILTLAQHFADKYAAAFEKPAPGFAPEAQQMLLCYEWPGNVRELEHVVERAVIFAETELIHGHDLTLPRSDANGQPESFQKMKAKVVTQFEKSFIQGLLLANQGNITKAAQAAQKNRRAFFELMRKHHIDPRSQRASY